MPDNPRLKDVYFSDAFLERLAADLARTLAGFDGHAFLACARGGGFEEMALMQKMHHITACLHDHAPRNYAETLGGFLQLAPGYTEFDGMVFSDYVASYGLGDWERSLPALRELTRAISAEFAIRPFLRHDPDRVLPYLHRWVLDPDPAVRRLVSEGTRPRLPWGMALTAFKKDPAPLVPILTQLRDDPSEDVRRSVANNLNDIAKDNPGLVLDLAEAWYGESEDTDRLVKHACRTLLKRGEVRAMRLFGFAEPNQVGIVDLTIDPLRPSIGETAIITYMLQVQTTAPFLLRLEYALSFARAGGKQSRKVFFQRESVFEPGDHTLAKKHSFRNLSTRKHYPGPHRLDIILNGVVVAQQDFDLKPADA